MTEEVKVFIKQMKKKLKADTKLANIKVTAGGWRGYDVTVEFNKEKKQYVVDFYSPIRITDPQRLEVAYSYAVGWIQGYEAGRKKSL